MNSNNLWQWTSKQPADVVYVKTPGNTVIFNRFHSRGTAVAIGDVTFHHNNHYYWEIKIMSTLYGTDTMIGVGTKNVDSGKGLDSYKSFLGSDSESYGYSFKGKKQHDGKSAKYSVPFKRGSVVGIHLDMWHGTIEFYLNRKPLGIAFNNLKCKESLHPMICSTAARCSMKLTYYNSQPASMYMHMIKYVSCHPDLLMKIKQIPGFNHLFSKELFWLLLPTSGSNISSDNYDETYMELMYQQSYCGMQILGEILKNNPDQLSDTNFPFNDNPLSVFGEISRALHNSQEEHNEDFTMDTDSADCDLRTVFSSDDTKLNSNNSVKFTGLSKTLCDVCRVNRAAVINDQQVTLNMCLGCFYKV